jgi:hypothetical protein
MKSVVEIPRLEVQNQNYNGSARPRPRPRMSQQKQDQKEDYQCLGFGIDLLITRCTI